MILTGSTVKAQELEALADAVRSENYRVYALQAQAQSVPSHLPSSQPFTLSYRGLQFYAGLAEPPPGFINTNKHGIDWVCVAQKVNALTNV